MTADSCYICHSKIPNHQSFFGKGDRKICLNCYRSYPKCKKCGTPSKNLRSDFGEENICSTCIEKLSQRKSVPCFLCEESIWPNMSRYEGHGHSICQKCFTDAKHRCFFCGFPDVIPDSMENTPYCEFCKPELVFKKEDLSSLLPPIKSFLNHFAINHFDFSSTTFTTSKQLLPLQGLKSDCKIQSFEELIKQAYPVYQLKGRFYIVGPISKQWVLPLLAIQLSVAHFCKQYHLDHLSGDTPFHSYLQGWCHYIGYFMAKTLQYKTQTKTLEKFPGNSFKGDFLKFLAMSEFRPPKEMIQHSLVTIESFYKRYL